MGTRVQYSPMMHLERVGVSTTVTYLSTLRVTRYYEKGVVRRGVLRECGGGGDNKEGTYKYSIQIKGMTCELVIFSLTLSNHHPHLIHP